MSTFAFVLVGAMLGIYVLLDGYDLGVATFGYFVAGNERERGATMASIGPFWNGNEVWLIAAGGALFALFPKAYASAFSGFYLPFVVLLWLLMVRGIAMELRGHLPSAIWRVFWDFAFFASSALLIAVLGLALGNLIRGVPLDSEGYFRGTFAFLLNPYALSVAIFSLLALALHGGAFLTYRLTGVYAERCRRNVLILFWPVVAGYVALTAVTLDLHPGLALGVLWPAPLVALASLAALLAFARRADGARTFAASSLFLASLLYAAGATLYPYLLVGYPPGSGGLRIDDAAPSPAALATALTVTLVGIVVVLGYATFAFRRFTEPLRVD